MDIQRITDPAISIIRDIRNHQQMSEEMADNVVSQRMNQLPNRGYQLVFLTILMELAQEASGDPVNSPDQLQQRLLSRVYDHSKRSLANMIPRPEL